IDEYPRRHQACQAPTDDHRVLPKVMCHTNLLSFCRCVSTHVLPASVSATVPWRPSAGRPTPRSGHSSHPTGRHNASRPLKARVELALRPVRCLPPYAAARLLGLLSNRLPQPPMGRSTRGIVDSQALRVRPQLSRVLPNLKRFALSSPDPDRSPPAC